VHGGLDFAAPIVVTDDAMARLTTLVPLAPLHQPHNLSGIAAAQAAFPGVAQVACFDTAFHRAHPFVNDAFALPRSLYEQGVRRYGFHGLSYEYITGKLAEVAPFHAKGRVVICHLGSGASMCAIRNGHSVASTMGFSALDGLPMGTRPGQLDPGVLLYLMDQMGMQPKAISDLLYKESGLKGLSGISNDMRDLEASDDPKARQAIDYFVFRVRREIGGMAAVLEGLDAIVFCGGIGENSRTIREAVLRSMEWIGIELDPQRNHANAEIISSDRSAVRVFVIRTNEELMIARHSDALLSPQAMHRVA
jgi:acetate kinase